MRHNNHHSLSATLPSHDGPKTLPPREWDIALPIQQIDESLESMTDADWEALNCDWGRRGYTYAEHMAARQKHHRCMADIARKKRANALDTIRASTWKDYRRKGE